MSKSIESVDLVGKTIITKDRKRYTIRGYIMHGDFIAIQNDGKQILISPKDVKDIVEPREVPTDLEYLYLGYADGEW